MKPIEITVATAIRIEHNERTDDVYLVFEIVDDEFKKQIKEDWMQDIPLKIIGKSLYRKE